MGQLTTSKQQELLGHIRAGMRPGAAAEALGFTRTFLYDFLEEQEEFAAEVKKAEREATEHVEEALYQAAISGNVTAARIWLDRSEKKPKSTALVPAAPTEPSDDGFDQELAELNAIARGEKRA